MRRIDIQQGRICSDCGQMKPQEAFLWKRRGRQLNPRCTPCRLARYRESPDRVRERAREYYAKNREEVNRRGRERRVLNVANELYKGAKARAQERGVPFSISPGDVVVPDTCPVLGIPLAVGTGKCSACSPTLDRIQPQLGYVPGNVAVISFRANTIKNDSTLEELEKVLAYMRVYDQHIAGQGGAEGSI